MINLLPVELKDGYRFARRNHHLSRWVLAFLLAILGAALLTGFGWIYINHMSNVYQAQITKSEENLKARQYDQVQKQVKEMSNNLELSVQVLSKQVLFSELLKRLGSLMPKDTKLTGLTIAQTQGAIDITASAKDQTAATQVQVNLTDAKDAVFSKVDIVSINCAYGTTDAYPCKATFRALFAEKNPFLFIGDTKGGS
jgi:alpha-L-arabinofuranosidase